MLASQFIRCEEISTRILLHSGSSFFLLPPLITAFHVPICCLLAVLVLCPSLILRSYTQALSLFISRSQCFARCHFVNRTALFTGTDKLSPIVEVSSQHLKIWLSKGAKVSSTRRKRLNSSPREFAPPPFLIFPRGCANWRRWRRCGPSIIVNCTVCKPVERGGWKKTPYEVSPRPP